MTLPANVYDLSVFGDTCEYYATNLRAGKGQEIGRLACNKYYEAICVVGTMQGAQPCKMASTAVLTLNQRAVCTWP